MSSNLITITKFSTEQFLEMMSWQLKSHTLILDDKIYIFNLQDSKRLKIFSKNLRCVECGLEGNCFKLELAKNAKPRKNVILSTCYVKHCLKCHPKEYPLFQPHINMYHQNTIGELVLMTNDHIIPRSKGGPDSLHNLQTMCTWCNQRKGNSYVQEKESSSQSLSFAG